MKTTCSLDLDISCTFHEGFAQSGTLSAKQLPHPALMTYLPVTAFVRYTSDPIVQDTFYNQVLAGSKCHVWFVLNGLNTK